MVDLLRLLVVCVVRVGLHLVGAVEGTDKEKSGAKLSIGRKEIKHMKAH